MAATTTNAKSFEDMVAEMFRAAKTGSLEELQKIVEDAANDEERKELINSEDIFDKSILHAATKTRHVNAIEWILSEQGGRVAGFDVGLHFPPLKQTVLHIAVQKGNMETFKAIVNGLRAENGEREKMLNAEDGSRRTILHDAVECERRDFMKWVLSTDEGGGRAIGFHNVLAKSTDGRTALHSARYLSSFLTVMDGCRVDNGEREEMLNAVDDDGWSVLHLATSRNQPEVITWLLSDDGGGAAAGFDRSHVTTKTKDVVSALHLAAGRSIESLQALLSNCTQQERMNLFLAVDKDGYSALCYAARKDLDECIIELFQHPQCSLIVNRKDNRGMTVLHRAVIGGLDEESRKRWSYFFAPDLDVIRALLGSTETGWTSIDPNIGLGLE